MRGDGTAAAALAFCAAALIWNLLHAAAPASAVLAPVAAAPTWPNARAALRAAVDSAAAPESAPPVPAPRDAQAVDERGAARVPLLGRLRDADAAQRERAVLDLVDEDEAAAVPLLAYALADTDAAVVLAAIDVARERGEVEVVDDLYLLLDHADSEVRRRASSAIRSLE
jgi:hypothetical protein